jgi:hypothetical protein
VEDDLAAVGRHLAEASRRRANPVAALADCDDQDRRAVLAEALDKLAEQVRHLEATRSELEGRRSVWSAAHARIGDVEAWAAKIASKLDDATYQTKRDALVWLGVTVRIFRARDRDRWIIEARLPLGEDTLSTRHCSG